jgi:hypothetical protein
MVRTTFAGTEQADALPEVDISTWRVSLGSDVGWAISRRLPTAGSPSQTRKRCAPLPFRSTGLELSASWPASLPRVRVTLGWQKNTPRMPDGV